MILSSRTGFTLLEICLALLIAAMLIALAVPGIAGVLAEQRLKESFERFDSLVAIAKRRSVTEQRTYAIVWSKKGITLQPAEGKKSTDDDDEPASLTVDRNESFQLYRPAALSKDAANEWVFWSNGICEPAQIAYQGKTGSWLVNYDPLTAHGVFVKSEVP